MRRLGITILAAGLLLLAPLASRAAIIPLAASLDGLQETPPVATPGYGSATLTFDTVSKLLSWNITYAALIGTITAAHFHGPAAPGVAAGVTVGIGALPSPMIGSATLTAGQETELLAGLWYINIHSTYKPGGEIRGQVTVVPEPGTLALVGLGLAALARARRRA